MTPDEKYNSINECNSWVQEMKEENEDMNIIYHNLKGADKAVPGGEWIYSTQFSN